MKKSASKFILIFSSYLNGKGLIILYPNSSFNLRKRISLSFNQITYRMMKKNQTAKEGERNRGRKVKRGMVVSNFSPM